MSLLVNRLRHQAKLFVGNQLERVLRKRYLRGQGPASRLISVFSDQAKRIGVEQNILIDPVPIKKPAPDYFIKGEAEAEYRRLIQSGEHFTSSAGIFSAQNVDVSFPTGMHQIGRYILDEVMPAPYILSNPKYYYGLESMRLRSKPVMAEGVLLSMPWHHNFYHWMIEMLPRLLLYDRCANLQNMPLIVPKSAPSFVAESLRLTGYNSKVVFMKDGAYCFNRLHMLSKLASTTEVSPDAVYWLNEKFKERSPTFIAPKRIYVSRRDAKIRFVDNESQLAGILSEFGFEALTMSDLPLVDQINIFRSADYIIGPHGAAFTNLTFSKPGATFIEFFSKGHFAPCFNRISGIRGLRYGFLVGEPNAYGGFSINPRHLKTILSRSLQS